MPKRLAFLFVDTPQLLAGTAQSLALRFQPNYLFRKGTHFVPEGRALGPARYQQLHIR
jgi:hypothetical protein